MMNKANDKSCIQPRMMFMIKKGEPNSRTMFKNQKITSYCHIY